MILNIDLRRISFLAQPFFPLFLLYRVQRQLLDFDALLFRESLCALSYEHYMRSFLHDNFG